MTVTVVGQKFLDAPVAEKPYINGKGITRTFQATQKSIRFGSQIGEFAGAKVPGPVKSLDQNLGTAIGALNFTRLHIVTADAIKAVYLMGKTKAQDGIGFARRAVMAVRDMLDAVAAYGYALTFIKQNPGIKMVAETADFTATSADLGLSCANYRKAQSYEQTSGLTMGMKNALSHTKRFHLLGIVKNVTSIAAVILGFSLLYTNATLIPAMILTIISLTSTIFAIKKDLHESKGQLISMDKDVVFKNPLQ
jgi:hypothetical protein